MDIAEELCVFIRSNLTEDGVVVEKNTSFDSLGLDSFSLIELILFIERKFGITLPDAELTKENLYSASTLAACVERNKA